MEDFIGVAAYFDAATDAMFEAFRECLRVRGINFHEQQLNPTHLTLGMYVGVSQGDILSWSCEFAKAHRPVPIKVTDYGTFPPSVLYAAVHMSAELALLHRAFHAKYDEMHGNIGQHYTPDGGWVPHITAVTQVTDLSAARELLRVHVPLSEHIPQGLTVCSFFPPCELGRFEFTR